MYKNDLPKSRENKKYETFKKKYCSEIDIAVEPKTDDANQDQRRCVLKNEKEFKDLLQIVNTSLSLGKKHQELILKKLSEDSFQNEYIIKIINKDGDIVDIPKSVGQGGFKKKYSKKNLRKKILNIKKFFSQRKK